MIDSTVLRHVRKITYSRIQPCKDSQGFKVLQYLLPFIFHLAVLLKIQTLRLLSQVVFRRAPLGNCKLG